MNKKYIIVSILLIGLAWNDLFMFLEIGFNGIYIAKESNDFFYGLELIIIIIIFSFAIVNLFNYILRCDLDTNC